MFLITRTFICGPMIVTILGVLVYFEKSQILRLNPKYVSYAFTNVTRYKRGGEYYLNFAFNNRVPMLNNVTVTIGIYEYRWNKYYRSIVEFRHKFCDFIEKDIYVGKSLGAAGLKCPVEPGMHTLMNLSVHFENFPSDFPFDKARVNVLFHVTGKSELLGEGAIYISAKNNIKNKKRT